MKRLTILTMAAIMSLISAPAFADRECKSDTYSRTGGERNSLYFARKSARDAWRTKVNEKVGKKWSAWYIANDHNYNCKANDGKHTCTAKAKPCRLNIVVQGPRKVCSIYKINGTGKPAKLKAWAKHKARSVWKSRVRDFYGSSFDTWTLSNDKKTTCKDHSDGSHTCTAQAEPCKFVLIK